jgi:mRNA export factor
MFGGGGTQTSSLSSLTAKKQDFKNDITVSKADDLPKDSVQCIKWCRNTSVKAFACGDWAGDLRIYMMEQGAAANGWTLALKGCMNLGSPVFKIDWSPDGSTVFACCSEGVVKALQVQSGNIVEVCKHPNMTTMEIGMFQNNLIVMTFGADGSMAIWKPGTAQPIITKKLPYGVFVSDYSYPFVVLGCQGSQVGLINFENFSNKEVKFFKCDLNSPILDVALRPESTRLAACSVDGRVCIVDFNFQSNGNLQHKNFILFRAHRIESQKDKKNSVLYQVNTLGFVKNRKDFLFTCGGESVVFFWDCEAKNKTKEFNHGGIPVTCGDIDQEAQLFAYSLGYDWHKGVWGLPNIKYRPLIMVHIVGPGEIKS